MDNVDPLGVGSLSTPPSANPAPLGTGNLNPVNGNNGASANPVAPLFDFSSWSPIGWVVAAALAYYLYQKFGKGLIKL